MSDIKPQHIDLNKAQGLTINWSDGSRSFYPIDYLRKMSPSAEMSVLRQEMRDNPLTILPDSMANQSGPLTATNGELVGNYAIRIEFSDGHTTGIYSWNYLRSIDPNQRIPEVTED